MLLNLAETKPKDVKTCWDFYDADPELFVPDFARYPITSDPLTISLHAASKGDIVILEMLIAKSSMTPLYQAHSEACAVWAKHQETERDYKRRIIFLEAQQEVLFEFFQEKMKKFRLSSQLRNELQAKLDQVNKLHAQRQDQKLPLIKLHATLDQTKQRQTLQLDRKMRLINAQVDIMFTFYYEKINIVPLENDYAELKKLLQVKTDKILNDFLQSYERLLANNKAVYHNGEFILLTPTLRKQFIATYKNKIRRERENTLISVYNKTTEELKEKYDSLSRWVTQLYKALSSHNRDKKLLNEQVSRTLMMITDAHKQRILNSHDIIIQLHQMQLRAFNIIRDVPGFYNVIKLPTISLHVQHPDTGNTLLHEALAHGEYQTALYLMQKGHSLTTSNNQGVRAIDMQDKHGHFLLLHLAAKKDYDRICDLILQGARIDLVDHRDQGLLDIEVNGHSFLNFLFNKLDSPDPEARYQQIFLRLACMTISFRHLLIRTPSDSTIFERLLTLPTARKNKIVQTLHMKRTEHFKSHFQVDINFALWQHFSILIEEHSLNDVLKFFRNITRESMLLQLKFMEGSYIALQRAKHDLNDEQLYRYIINLLKDIRLPSHARVNYLNYLRRYAEFEHRGSQPELQSYAILLPDDARDCFFDCEFTFFSNPLPQAKITQPTPPSLQPKRNLLAMIPTTAPLMSSSP